MRKKIYISLIMIFSFASSLLAQAVGSWQTFFSYNNVNKIIDTGENIYAISDGFLFSLNKDYESIETYSKINGLSDGLISNIEYSEQRKALIIVYANFNIDILTENGIFNISDVKRKTINNKTINSIYTYGDYAYLCCGFGIVVVNLKKYEIADTYVIGNDGGYTSVNDVAIIGKKIYALTDDGLKYINNDEKTNLSDYNNWNLITLPYENELPKKIISFNNNLFAIFTNTLYYYNQEDGKWNFVRDIIGYGIYKNKNYFEVFNDTRAYLFTKNSNDSYIVKYMFTVRNNDIIYDEDNKIFWGAVKDDNGNFPLCKIDTLGNILNTYNPIGPQSSSVARIKWDNNILLTASGGPYDKSYNTTGLIQTFDKKEWKYLTVKNLSDDLKKNAYSFKDIQDVIVDPTDTKRLYALGWSGLYEFYDYEFVEKYDPTNSSIEYASDNTTTALDGLFYDSNNNLYMLNMQCKDILQVKKADGTWKSLYYSKYTNVPTARRLFIDKNGRTWILSSRNGIGIFVLDNNKTPFNTSDDKSIYLTSFTENSSDGIKSFSPTTFRCVTEDLNGSIWVGTSNGPIIFNNPSSVFDSNYYISRVKITRTDNENLADYLLANEQVNTICVDGANRKWIGTATSGLYLVSDDGQETIQHFTTENSPLTSDCIMDLALDDKTGTLYIASSNGLFSYMNDAMEGFDSYNDVYVYPNPVKENYDGNIVVKGLMENSFVRIADIAGNVIWSGESNGGVFVWNGKRKNGTRVSSGIYFVIMALEDGSEKEVAKIAFIN